MSTETITWPDGETRVNSHPCPAHVARMLRAAQMSERYPRMSVVAAPGGFDLVGKTRTKQYRYTD